LTSDPLKVGVLAIQGDFEAHRRMLESLGAQATEVRTREALAGLDGLVIPGGESTTITMGMESEGLDDAITATAGRSSAAARG
jgi:5'-phosphate synthase pdxT subunit